MNQLRSLAALSVLSVAAGIASAASVAVDPAATQQSIVGFGGGSVYYQNWILGMSEKNQEALFDTAFTG